MDSILDSHCHLGHCGPEVTSPESLLEVMDSSSVGQAVVSPSRPCRDQSVADGNNRIIEAVNRYPDRLIGFALVDPTVEGGAVPELRRAVRAGLCGVNLKPNADGFSPAPGLLEHTLEFVASRNLPVLLHSGSNSTFVLDTIPQATSRFRETTFIITCPGNAYYWDEALAASADYGNILFDTADLPPRRILQLLGCVGVGRVLFGSRFPFGSVRFELAKLKALLTTQPDSADITGGNMAKLLAGAQGCQMSSPMSSAGAE